MVTTITHKRRAGTEGRYRYRSTHYSTLALEEGECSMPCPGHFNPGKETQ